MIDADTAIKILTVAIPVVLWVLGSIKKDIKDVKTDLKQNTDSTTSLAIKMAAMDGKIEGYVERANTISKRTHDLRNDMAVVKYKLGLPNTPQAPGDD